MTQEETMKELKQIENKLLELWDLLQTIPEDCKGAENSANRHRFLKIRKSIHILIEEE